jgi:hypothetical protein
MDLQTSALTMWRQLPWAARFPIVAATAIVILLALIWALTGFGGLGLDATATVGAVLGIVFTIALAVSLMTLIFYSNRSGTDELVADAGEPSAPGDKYAAAQNAASIPCNTASNNPMAVIAPITIANTCDKSRL